MPSTVGIQCIWLFFCLKCLFCVILGEGEKGCLNSFCGPQFRQSPCVRHVGVWCCSGLSVSGWVGLPSLSFSIGCCFRCKHRYSHPYLSFLLFSLNKTLLCTPKLTEICRLFLPSAETVTAISSCFPASYTAFAAVMYVLVSCLILLITCFNLNWFNKV